MSLARVTEILETINPVSVSPTDYTTTNDYASIGKLDSSGKTRVVYTIYNAHAANSIIWKVVASIDDVIYVEVKAAATLAAVTTASWVASAVETSYRYFKIQVKSNAAETPGTAQVRGYAKI